MKKVLITGITGQDGAYLAKLLLKRDWITVNYRDAFQMYACACECPSQSIPSRCHGP